jgi:phage terminase large subunit-like protein
MSIRQFEDLLLEKRIRIRRNPVVISAIMSATTDNDRWGNYWLAKERSTQKIDCAIALAQAIGAALSYESVRLNVGALISAGRTLV